MKIKRHKKNARRMFFEWAFRPSKAVHEFFDLITNAVIAGRIKSGQIKDHPDWRKCELKEPKKMLIMPNNAE